MRILPTLTALSLAGAAHAGGSIETQSTQTIDGVRTELACRLDVTEETVGSNEYDCLAYDVKTSDSRLKGKVCKPKAFDEGEVIRVDSSTGEGQLNKKRADELVEDILENPLTTFESTEWVKDNKRTLGGYEVSTAHGYQWGDDQSLSIVGTEIEEIKTACNVQDKKYGPTIFGGTRWRNYTDKSDAILPVIVENVVASRLNQLAEATGEALEKRGLCEEAGQPRVVTRSDIAFYSKKAIFHGNYHWSTNWIPKSSFTPNFVDTQRAAGYFEITCKTD